MRAFARGDCSPAIDGRAAHDRWPIVVRVVHVPPTYPQAVWMIPKAPRVPAGAAATGDSRRGRADETTIAQPWITTRKVWTSGGIVQNSRLDASWVCPVRIHLVGRANVPLSPIPVDNSVDKWGGLCISRVDRWRGHIHHSCGQGCGRRGIDRGWADRSPPLAWTGLWTCWGGCGW